METRFPWPFSYLCTTITSGVVWSARAFILKSRTKAVAQRERVALDADIWQYEGRRARLISWRRQLTPRHFCPRHRLHFQQFRAADTASGFARIFEALGSSDKLLTPQCHNTRLLSLPRKYGGQQQFGEGGGCELCTCIWNACRTWPRCFLLQM